MSHSKAVKHLAVPACGGAVRVPFPPGLPNTATWGGRAPPTAGCGVLFVILMFWSIGPFPRKVGVEVRISCMIQLLISASHQLLGSSEAPKPPYTRLGVPYRKWVRHDSVGIFDLLFLDPWESGFLAVIPLLTTSILAHWGAGLGSLVELVEMAYLHLQMLAWNFCSQDGDLIYPWLLR